MADPERCFCCLESDVLLHRCTCRCLTLAVCDRCFFELACKSRTCTVCRAPVGSAAVVRACEWALQSVRTLPPTDVARQTVELRALSEILWTHEYAPDAARTTELAAAYDAVLGPEHSAALHMKLLATFALSHCERYGEAYEQILQIEPALVRKWQEAPVASQFLLHTMMQQKAFCMWHVKARFHNMDAEAEEEYRRVLKFMLDTGVYMSSAYLSTLRMFSRLMKVRADELARLRRPTRAASALLLRATAVVEDAARAHAFAYGPDHEHSRLLHADVASMRSYASQ